MSWKDLQSKKKVAGKTRLAVAALIILLGLIVVSSAIKFSQSLFSPWKLTADRNFLWNGDFTLNFLIRARNVALVSFNPSDQKITIVNIPGTTFLDVAHGFGFWQLSSIYDLGEGSKIGGDRLLKLSLINFFGLPVDGVLDFSGRYKLKKPQEIVDEIKNAPFALADMLPVVKTDLTPYELIRLKLALAAVRFDGITEINLGETGALTKSNLADGTPVLLADDQKLDYVLSGLADSQIKSEHKTIAVFNATDHALLGSRAARLINNLGGNVIIVANYDNKIVKTEVLGEKSKTADRLKQIFGPPIGEASKNDKLGLKIKDQILARAQINIFLGEDYFQNQ